MLTDTSKNKKTKLLLVFVTYFVYKTGGEIKILELKLLLGETFVIVSD